MKRVILFSTIAFGLLSCATVFVGSTSQLIGIRFLTGIGLGAALPSSIALTSEYSPGKSRATYVMGVYIGFSLGFIAAGVAAAWIIPIVGWRALFWTGSVAPLVLASIIFVYLPGVPSFCAEDSAEPLLQKSRPGDTTERDRPATAGNLVGQLFGGSLAPGTLILWFVCFLNQGVLYALQSWMPSVLGSLGHPPGAVAFTTSLLSVGGIVAALIIGPAMDRLGPYASMAVVYAVGAVSICCLGSVVSSESWLLPFATLLSGFCAGGGQRASPPYRQFSTRRRFDRQGLGGA